MKRIILGPRARFCITVDLLDDGRFQATAYDADRPNRNEKPTPFVIVILKDEHDAVATCRQHVIESKAWADAQQEWEASF